MIIYVGGQNGVDVMGVVVFVDVGEQLLCVFENVCIVLELVGVGFDDVISWSVLIYQEVDLCVVYGVVVFIFVREGVFFLVIVVIVVGFGVFGVLIEVSVVVVVIWD